MKYLYYILSFVLAMVISSCSSTRYYQSNPDDYTQNYDQQQMITYQQFYNDLSPYGDWINYEGYGYAWMPYEANFRPYYTNGYWVYTNYGWTWISNYNWGWAPFHYGRWINDVHFGWMWIPGYQWAPAWVTWRGGGDYYGWAPLGPGMSVTVNSGSIPYNNWTFVPRRYINSPRINNYYINSSRNALVINNTTIINNTNITTNQNNGIRHAAYNPGPPVREVEQTTGTRVRRYNLLTTNKSEGTQVTNSSVRLFRPAVKPQPASSFPRPEKVKSQEEIRAIHSAPVREFPKDQTPEVLKNEPPVNNNPPGLTPERNNTPPARVFPKTSENPQSEESPVVPKPQNHNNPRANSHPEENKQLSTPPVRVFPKNPTPPPTNQKPNEPQIRKAPANNNLQLNESRNDKPVRTFSNPQSAVKPNEYKQNESESNPRPVITPRKMSNTNQHQSNPSQKPIPKNNSPVHQPVRTVNPKSVPLSQPQKQKDEKHAVKNVRTFNPYTK